MRFLKRQYGAYRQSPKTFKAYANNANAYLQGSDYGSNWTSESYRDTENRGVPKNRREAGGDNELLEYFRNNQKGPGIWKWEHYFDVYQRHFSKFVNQPVDILEIGVYSGGSLYMWQSYFGDRSRVIGVDREPACKAYERDGVTIMIGDQEDRGFWKNLRSTVAGIDVLIDDGGHTPGQQIVTLEEMLPHIRPGGVYICEDTLGLNHQLVSYASGLISELNRLETEGAPSGFQKSVHSIHFYPYLMVIEKHATPPSKLHAPKHGTEWQPFLDRKA